MQEFPLVQRIVATILKNLGNGADFQGRQVREVILEIGALDIRSPESVRQAYEALVQDTPLAASTLNLRLIPGLISCLRCGYQGECLSQVNGHDPLPYIECPRCGTLTSISGGRGLVAVELILED